jgi:hypothetical protein
MTQPRRFARVRPAGLMSDEARLIVGAKLPVVNCHIVDYSAGGACIELARDVTLPARFELLHGAVKKRCRVVWKRGLRLGLVF